MPKRGRPPGSTITKNSNRLKFYKRGEKERQRYLINNHASVTAFLLAIISKHFHIIISFPIRVSFVTLTFPRIKTIILSEEEDIQFVDIVRERLEVKKNEKNKGKEIIPVDARINFIHHYEIYHLLYDIVYLIEDVEIMNEIEETSGLSGDFSIRYYERIYKWEEIKEIGGRLIDRMYGNRMKGERSRIIKKGELCDYLI